MSIIVDGEYNVIRVEKEETERDREIAEIIGNIEGI